MTARPARLTPVALALASALALAAGPALAQDPEPTPEEDALEYAWSNSMYTMYHEIGHLFIDQYEVPVLSKEEDAADNLATLMVLQDFQDSGDRILEDAAYGWALSEAWEEQGIDDATFADEHSLDQQRAYAMVCLLVGADPDAFGPTADDWGMDPDRQERCAGDFEQAAASWDAVLGPHRKAAEAEGPVMIDVVYDAPDAGFEDIAAYLADTGLLETAAARVEAEYALPAPVTFRAAMCGEDNAFYDPSVPEVVLCYEHAQAHYERYLASLS